MRHEYHTGEHALVSDKLGPMEVVLFVRCTCFRHNNMVLPQRLPGEKVLVRALMRAVVEWQQKHELLIPNIEDIEDEIARSDSESAAALSLDQPDCLRKRRKKNP